MLLRAFKKRSILIVVLTQCFIISEAQQHMATWIGGSDQHSAKSIGSLGTQSENTWPGIPGGMFWGFKPNTWWNESTQEFWLLQGSTNKLWKFDVEKDMWTWVKGTDVIYEDPNIMLEPVGEAGVYGNQGFGDPSNVPGARFNALQWIDQEGDLYLYGGEGFDGNGDFGFLSDMWKFSPATTNWIWIGGPTTVMIYSTEYGKLGVADSKNWPGKRHHSCTWVDNMGKFWLYGGAGFSNDIWQFDPETELWTWLAGDENVTSLAPIFGLLGESSPDNNPGNRVLATTWTDLDNNLWLFGGTGNDKDGDGFQWLNDLWKFNINTLEWTWVAGSNRGNYYGIAGNYGEKGVSKETNYPGSRNGALAIEAPDGLIWFFGGEGVGATSGGGLIGPLNDLWIFNPKSTEWTWVGGLKDQENGLPPIGKYNDKHNCSSDNWPGSRSNAVGFATKGQTYMFGGWGIGITYEGAGEMNDLWKFTKVSTPNITGSSNISQTSFTLNWEDAEYATSYKLDVSTDSFQTFLDGFLEKEVLATEIHFEHLDPGSYYYSRIRAINSGCIGNNSEIYQQVTIPETPIAGPPEMSYDSFKASWSSSIGANGYYLDLSNDNFLSYLDGYNDQIVTNTSFEMAGLEIGNEYQYRVRSYNQSGVSPYSNTVRILISDVDDVLEKTMNSLYPNPTTGICTLETNYQSKENFSIIDLNGTTVYKGVTEGAQTVINASNLNNGLYFLIVEGQKLKILKQ